MVSRQDANKKIGCPGSLTLNGPIYPPSSRIVTKSNTQSFSGVVLKKTWHPLLRRRSPGKSLLAIVAIAVIVIAITPIALAGAFNVPLAIASFDERTGLSGTGSLAVTTQIVTAWQYFFNVRTQGMVRTSSSNASSNGGTTNITITLTLTNPSNQTIDLGQTTINGGIGGRTHTIYLSIDQGVRANGNYRLDVTFTANVVLLGGLVEAPFSTTLHSSFVISGQ